MTAWPAGRVRAANWGYRHPGRATWAVRGAELDLAPGSLNLVLGASGSGKSTLLAGMAGVLGEGEEAGDLAVGGRVGLVSQDPSGNIVMERVGDDIAFTLENQAVPPGEIWARVHAALELVGLQLPLDRSTTELSGGQLQLLALAAALAGRPDVLLLDEPTANLDPPAAALVATAVTRARQELGCTVVLIEHRVDPWLPHADRLVIVRPPVDAGSSIEMISPAELPSRLSGDPALAAGLWVREPGLGETAPRPAEARPAPVLLRAGDVTLGARLPAPVCLDLPAGEILALTGPPGSGKSSLLAALVGLLDPAGGQITLHSAAGAQSVPAMRSAELARHFGVVFQNPEHQFLTGTAAGELHYSLAAAGAESTAAARVPAMLERMGLAGLGQANPFTLSGGQQRRLSVATALIRDPGLLVLDEPTYGQDPQSWNALVEIMAEHRAAGGAVLLATHDPRLIAALGAREVRLPPPPPLPPVREPGAQLGATGLRRLNPLVLMLIALAASIAGLASRSVPANLLMASAALLAGLFWAPSRRRLLWLLAPVALATFSVALSNALLAPGGLAGPGNLARAALPASRVLAISLPGLVAAISLDPTALADNLTSRLRVPARPAYAVLAGLRLLPLLFTEATLLRQASRARGQVGNRLTQFTSLSFRLLVAALRRGGRLAVALDVRGLSSTVPRTCARPVRLTWWDALGIGLVSAVGAAAAAIAG
ncbi:MAG: ATP-binding cassette domain-containing protein [Candidatus Nanopelagicales bacterium]